MSDGMLLNKIIETLEKSQGIKIWTSPNPITKETEAQLKALVHEYRDSEINKHVVNLFGANATKQEG